MSITSGALSKTFVVVSDTAPSSPFEGQLWRDTTADTLKQWDGSSWVSVQSSPDTESIDKDSNGELFVKFWETRRVTRNVEVESPDGRGNVGTSKTIASINGGSTTYKIEELTMNTSDQTSNLEIWVKNSGGTKVFSQTFSHDGSGDNTFIIDYIIDKDGYSIGYENPDSSEFKVSDTFTVNSEDDQNITEEDISLATDKQKMIKYVVAS